MFTGVALAEPCDHLVVRVIRVIRVIKVVRVVRVIKGSFKGH